jgi:hypothetical protein
LNPDRKHNYVEALKSIGLDPANNPSRKRIAKRMKEVKFQIYPGAEDAVRKGYRDALIRPNNHLMKAKTLIERAWRKVADDGAAQIPSEPSHNHGAKHIEKDGTIGILLQQATQLDTHFLCMKQ